MGTTSRLSTAVEIYFDARSRMFPGDPDFRVFRAGPLRGFHRHPRWPEQDAFYALDVDPKDAVAAVSAYGPHPHHMITVFVDAAAPLQAAYTELGYKSVGGTGQPFMARSLEAASGGADAIAVQRVRTEMDLAFINATGAVMDPSHLNADAFRYYVVERDGRPVCTGRYVMTPLGAVYLAGMETHPEYRRQGLASALMNKIHADAADEGATASVLCSSPIGLGLYRSLGYEILAMMCSFVPNEWTI